MSSHGQLEQKVEAIIRSATSLYEASAPLISVVLAGSPEFNFDINGSIFHKPASTMKLPVMLEVFRLIDVKAVSLLDTVLVENKFQSVQPGAGWFSVNPIEDSDFQLYNYVGQRVTVRFLLERVITLSSNLATNLLFAMIDVDHLKAGLEGLDAGDITVIRGIEDMAANESGVKSHVTARGLATLLEAIANETAASPASCREMLAILSRQQWNDEIPGRLPAEVVVAHKTGWLDGIQHDAALVYPPTAPPYVLTILTTGVADTHVARRLMQTISAQIYGRVTKSS